MFYNREGRMARFSESRIKITMKTNVIKEVSNAVKEL
jgi:hypothetical protein